MKYFSFQSGRSRQTVMLGLLLMILSGNPFSACRKVDEHADLIENQPYLITVGGFGGLFNIWGYAYQQTFLVGDTATLAGRLFIDRPGNSVQVGKTEAVIIAKGKVSTNQFNTRTGQEDSLEVIRFLITKEMGIGANIPLTYHANGYTVQGLPLTIKAINIGDRRTDTTLVVDKLAAWLPGNIAAFQASYSTPFVNNSSVAGDGTLYFDNMNGIFQVTPQQVLPIILTGSSLTDQQQNTFSIDVIISSVISPDGHSLLFSSIVKENIPPAADSLYVIRLCRMDMNSKQITTLNRTTTLKGMGPYQETLGPFSGNVNTLKIAAANLRTDISGNIWFTNLYFPVNNQTNQITYSTFNSTNDWYGQLQLCSYAQPPYAALYNICRMDVNGQVNSLMQTNPWGGFGPPPYITPGPLFSDNSTTFITSPDGSVVYGAKQPASTFYLNINQYVLAQGDIENTIIGAQFNFSFISFDTAAATKLSSNGSFSPPELYDADFNTCLLLPNNDMLYASSQSLYAYNFDNNTAYCYAGTENQNASVQTQETGKAQLVNFNSSNQLRFCGIDQQGAVYYCIGGSYGSYSSNDFTNGVRFYKLHSAK